MNQQKKEKDKQQINIEMLHNNRCPICKSYKHKLLCQSLHYCKLCLNVFNSDFKELKYERNYFLSEYKEQYGKTYEDDFDNIYETSKKRLLNIFGYLNNSDYKDYKLLDIGSALGFFLKCASDLGIKNVTGIEISDYATDYCKNNFNIQVKNCSISSIEKLEPFNIITAWYFIEHCNDPVDIISLIYNSLTCGGIFAFSTPSIFGPYYYLNKEHWIDFHPVDHRIDFSPRGIKRVLLKIGFNKVFVKPSGFHPERIISRESIFFKPFSYIFKNFSRITSFSDTIEVYAVK